MAHTKNRPHFNTHSFCKAIHGVDVMAIYGIGEGAGLEIPLLLSNPEEYFKQVYKLGIAELDAKKKLLEKIRGWLAKQEISSTRAKCRTMIFHNATSLWQSRTPTFDTSKVQSLDLTISLNPIRYVWGIHLLAKSLVFQTDFCRRILNRK